jgi:hypothetical protein
MAVEANAVAWHLNKTKQDQNKTKTLKQKAQIS